MMHNGAVRNIPFRSAFRKFQKKKPFRAVQINNIQGSIAH